MRQCIGPDPSNLPLGVSPVEGGGSLQGGWFGVSGPMEASCFLWGWVQRSERSKLHLRWQMARVKENTLREVRSCHMLVLLWDTMHQFSTKAKALN